MPPAQTAPSARVVQIGKTDEVVDEANQQAAVRAAGAPLPQRLSWYRRPVGRAGECNVLPLLNQAETDTGADAPREFFDYGAFLVGEISAVRGENCTTMFQSDSLTALISSPRTGFRSRLLRLLHQAR